MGAIGDNLGPVGLVENKLLGFEVTIRQYEHEWICSKTPFCFVNISAPLNHTEMVLYSKSAYGSWFSGEKNNLKILHLVVEILGKNPVSFFLGRPVFSVSLCV